VLWPAADTLVWLDLPRHTAFRRAVFRTLRRAMTRERLWNANRQGLDVLRPASLLALWRRWPSYSAATAALLGQDEFNHLRVVRLRSPTDVRAWLGSQRCFEEGA
jgi:hypothetical protein